MPWSPLGSLDPENVPLLPEALTAARVLRAGLPGVPAGAITRLYAHWMVGHLDQTSDEYNVMVDLVGGAWKLSVTHDPRDNATGVNDHEEASHTWHRNTGALGISVAGMWGASPTNFGSDALSFHELHFMCAALAACATAYGIDCRGRVANGSTHTDNDGNPRTTTGEPNIATHAECAVWDGYPRERWDFGCLVPMDAQTAAFLAASQGDSLPSPSMRYQCGAALRTLAHRYKVLL